MASGTAGKRAGWDWVVLTSKKKMPYLSDPKFLGYKGFIRADSAEPYFELFYLP